MRSEAEAQVGLEAEEAGPWPPVSDAGSGVSRDLHRVRGFSSRACEQSTRQPRHCAGPSRSSLCQLRCERSHKAAVAFALLEKPFSAKWLPARGVQRRATAQQSRLSHAQRVRENVEILSSTWMRKSRQVTRAWAGRRRSGARARIYFRLAEKRLTEF
jgi:hypothetical protein